MIKFNLIRIAVSTILLSALISSSVCAAHSNIEQCFTVKAAINNNPQLPAEAKEAIFNFCTKIVQKADEKGLTINEYLKLHPNDPDRLHFMNQMKNVYQQTEATYPGCVAWCAGVIVSELIPIIGPFVAEAAFYGYILVCGSIYNCDPI
ncbi:MULTISPECIES: hypothetical protein [unclassified Legionella]|uniref:hypothetical protein n=1 Tax=unclassified Legionella TaxID=2622702 RepID=UPI001055B5AE|nr:MULTISPECIES: hypothetical protein [unclassified Legionella]MDI9819881.1 hypothetical protein [Legionella sp. PL877]